MLDPTTTAIVTGAAGNVVAYMLNGPVDALRTWIARTFRGGPEERRSMLHALEEDVTALTYRSRSEKEVKGRWTDLLASYLAAHPEAREDVEALALMSTAPRVMNIGAQHNHGSGTFIGGDNYGDINSS